MDEPKKERKTIVKMLNVVKEKHLYKMCNKCDSVNPITEYSVIKVIGNLIYTQGKCKACRNKQFTEYYRAKKN